MGCCTNFPKNNFTSTGSGGHNLPLLQHKVFVDREQYFHQQQFVWDQMGTGQMSSTWQI